MKKAELIAAVAAKANVSQKEAGEVVAAVLDEIKEALKKGDKVQLVGFGSFEVRAKAARKGKNPRTGEEITIAASKAPAFKAGKAFKDYIA
ncbi:MAG: HU family DNA-binding protein [Clostridia bacterium]|nr:HU family DNA-binding protein [Clostridia bacterium]